MITLDVLRAKYPHLGMALYAYEPGGPVTFECHAGEKIFTFAGPTAEAAMASAFPEDAEPEPPTPDPPTSVFD